jgi:hypothetical protein
MVLEAEGVTYRTKVRISFKYERGSQGGTG